MPSNFSLYEICYRGLLSTLLLLFSSVCVAGPDTLPPDKAAHFGLSSVAVEATMKSCQAIEGNTVVSPACRYGSSALVLTVGLLKEVSDQKRGGRFDEQDLVANVLGVITGNLLQWTF